MMRNIFETCCSTIIFVWGFQFRSFSVNYLCCSSVSFNILTSSLGLISNVQSLPVLLDVTSLLSQQVQLSLKQCSLNDLYWLAEWWDFSPLHQLLTTQIYIVSFHIHNLQKLTYHDWFLKHLQRVTDFSLLHVDKHNYPSYHCYWV